MNRKQRLEFWNWWGFSISLATIAYFSIQILRYYNLW